MGRGEQKYLFLVSWIKEKIAKGEFVSGDKLYSENELGTMFGMSRQTVRHAIGMLENEGLVERIQGSGTYISGKKEKSRKKNRNIMVITTYVQHHKLKRICFEIGRFFYL